MSENTLSTSRLATRVLLWAIGISALVFTAVTVLTALHENDQIFETAQQNARGSVARALPAISTGLWNFDKPALDATLASLTQYGPIKRAAVRDSGGRVVSRVDRYDATATAEPPLEVAIPQPDGS